MMNIYLLSINELRETSLDSELYREALEKVDSGRRDKIMRLTGEGKKKISLGAGLLLQYAVKMHEQMGEKLTSEKAVDVTECNEAVQDEKTQYGRMGQGVGVCYESIKCLYIRDIIKEIQHPQDFTYTYGQNGKPYFSNLPISFNLSHSGDYVLCAVADTEIGADIQQMNDINYWKMAERFFRQGEIEQMRRLATMEEQKRFFYRLWTRKEAYGKYIGEGVSKVLAVDMVDFPEGTMWEEYEIQNEYCIAVCRAK